MALIGGAIVIGMWLFTYFDKVSRDSFVFVIGALIGYILLSTKVFRNTN
jgi:hypothetical protein